jgi:hypothetical protein
MSLRLFKEIYATPWLRLNIFNRGISLSIGHRFPWLYTIGPRGFRETIDVMPGVFITETQRLTIRAESDANEPSPRTQNARQIHSTLYWRSDGIR